MAGADDRGAALGAAPGLARGVALGAAWRRWKAVVVALCLLMPALLCGIKLARGAAPYLVNFYLATAAVYIAVALAYLTPLRARLSGRLWVGFGFTVVCLLLLVDWIDPEVAWQALRTANPALLALMLLPYLLSYPLRAWRWQLLLLPVKKISFKNSFDALMIGFWGNCIYPARAGEFLRAYAIAKTENISTSAAFATVVMERIWDGIMILLLLLVLLLTFPLASPEVRWGGVVGMVFFGGALALMLVVHFAEARVVALLRRLLGGLLPPPQLDRVVAMLGSFSRGIAVVRQPGQLLLIFGSTLLIWLLSVAALYPVLLAFDFGMQFTPVTLAAGATVTLVASSLAITVPSAPGGAGPFHVAVLIALGAIVPPDAGIDLLRFKSVSGSFSVAYWLLSVLPVIIIGFYSLWSARVQVREVRELADEV